MVNQEGGGGAHACGQAGRQAGRQSAWQVRGGVVNISQHAKAAAAGQRTTCWCDGASLEQRRGCLVPPALTSRLKWPCFQRGIRLRALSSSPISVPSTRSSLPTCKQCAGKVCGTQSEASRQGRGVGGHQEQQQQLLQLLLRKLPAVPPAATTASPHLVDLVSVIWSVVAQQEAKQR